VKYLLDTNACITYLNVPNSPIARTLQTLQSRDVVVCSVVRAELIYGAYRNRNPTRALATTQEFLRQFVSLPFDDAAADEYGRIRADLTARGMLIGPNDLLIAAIATANNVTLVTHNTREFNRVPGLQIEDWEVAP
jgi:tRNA(fMet)-specific endonuclease VapC